MLTDLVAQADVDHITIVARAGSRRLYRLIYEPLGFLVTQDANRPHLRREPAH